MYSSANSGGLIEAAGRRASLPALRRIPPRIAEASLKHGEVAQDCELDPEYSSANSGGLIEAVSDSNFAAPLLCIPPRIAEASLKQRH